MSQSTTYKDAGVDIDKANALVEDIKHIAKRTKRPGVMAGIGGVGAMFEIPEYFQQPILVSGTDGVGTKLKLAMDFNQHDTIGIDLVAMCVNDIICCGAEPLFFLDYYATGKLNTEQAKDVITGIGAGCELSGCALIGGETAEMPGMYSGDDYDLAGFCVGAVEKSKIIDGSNVQAGDKIIGLTSSGAHSNGYSLIRYIIEKNNIDTNMELDGKPLSEWLLAPTRIYTKTIQALLRQVDVHALAHITGGGLTENIPRVLPKNIQAKLNFDSWEWSPLFKWLQKTGSVTHNEMIKSFNVGIGMIIVVSADDAELAMDTLSETDDTAILIGEVTTQ